MTLSPPNLVESYRSRPVRFLGVADLTGWRVKTYGISAAAERPPEALTEAAKRLARDRLPHPPAWSPPVGDDAEIRKDRYGVAIMIVHEAREGCFVLVSWWVGENMLEHHAWFASDGPPFAFESLADTGIAACVWELAVLAFERDAWVETVLARPDEPDLEAYLDRRMDEDV